MTDWFEELCATLGVDPEKGLGDPVVAASVAETIRYNPLPPLETSKVCPRCGGSGFFREFIRVNGGTCFKCGGLGRIFPA
jgi:hypothetical protein